MYFGPKPMPMLTDLSPSSEQLQNYLKTCETVSNKEKVNKWLNECSYYHTPPDDVPEIN
jgi:hypothetical protein